MNVSATQFTLFGLSKDFLRHLYLNFLFVIFPNNLKPWFLSDNTIFQMYSKKRNMGPSKNYVTARGKEGVDNFVTYRYVYLRGRGVFYEIVTYSRY